ncbi:MAG: DNA repair protein RadA [Longimicrobiales bacterium]|nr:DNA repair protein RadA [Longimicrobiales bacterium]
MAKSKTVFFCTECGNETARWQGQCPACGEWNALVEELKPRKSSSRKSSISRSRAGPSSRSESRPTRLSEVHPNATERWSTGIRELDFVLGGGVVPGSLILLGGEPGIGKSTLLLQVAARLEARGNATLYISGEESAGQIRMRADRLGDGAGDVLFLGETELGQILDRAEQAEPDVLVVDSIQTTYTDDLDGAPGNVSQVRECAARLQRFAKQTGAAVFLVGHVTKGGTVAGPRTLEHIVDTVLYFEGSRSLDHRVLRANKNRFGGVDEIGVFRMTGTGLEAVESPSELFLGERSGGASGSAVVSTLEGTRPLLVEVQALVSRSSYGSPQRVTTGFDRQRLALLLAVLEKRAGLSYGDQDVFLNAVGGVRITEPASDAGVVAALATGLLDRTTATDAVFVGEVGLGGEIRSAGQIERRLSEAERLGFRTAFVPARTRAVVDLELVKVATVSELLEAL